jgi:hypothetical protein
MAVVPDRRILAPAKDGDHYFYPDLEVKPAANKHGQDGVFAKTLIRANSILYYEGKRINQEAFELLQDEAREDPDHPAKHNQYIIDTGIAGQYIDGNPRFHPYRRVGGRGKYIAGKINEPKRGCETENMLASYDKDADGIPRPAFVAVKDIIPGHELLTHYGNSFERRDYRPGKRARFPKWWRKRNKAQIVVE